MEENKSKRKTHTSNAVKLRYSKKTYQQYGIKLRIIEDAELIKKIEAEKAKGYNTTEVFRRLLNANI